MTRTPKEAAEGRLNLLVGGDAALFEACRPLLACFAENITHVGAVGAGHSMKLLHNYVSLGSVALLAEAAACAQRNGVAPEVFVDVLAKGGGGGMALERLKPYLLAGDTSGLRFSIANASKDLGYYNTMAGDAGATWRLPRPCWTHCKAQMPRRRRAPCCRNWSACSGLRLRPEPASASPTTNPWPP